LCWLRITTPQEENFLVCIHEQRLVAHLPREPTSSHEGAAAFGLFWLRAHPSPGSLLSTQPSPLCLDLILWASPTWGALPVSLQSPLVCILFSSTLFFLKYLFHYLTCVNGFNCEFPCMHRM
jgi:hypothetical protein